MIVRQSRIYRADLQANPDVLYVFGDNVRRVGMGGQAGEMRGEPNAVGIATKWSPGREEDDYFSDDEYQTATAIIQQDFAPVKLSLRLGATVVFPLDGIGTGLSELPERAPRIFEYLRTLGLGGSQ